MEKLSNVSKIRKFITAELKKSGLIDLYSTYWLEMETSYIEASERENRILLEEFFLDYLTIQNDGVIPKKENLFSNFVEFYQKVSKFQKKDLIIKNIFRYSKKY